MSHPALTFDQLVMEFRAKLQPISQRFITKNHPEFIQTINQSSCLVTFSTLPEKIWALRTATQTVPTCYCGTPTLFVPNTGKYRQFCSHRCARLNPKSKLTRNAKRTQSGVAAKIQNTINSRYTAEQIKSLRQQGVIAKYGVSNYFATEEFKATNKARNLQKYGVEHYTQTDISKQQYKQTCLKKYGVEHYAKSLIYRESLADRTAQSKIRLYNQHGVEHSSQIKIADVIELLRDPEWLYEQYIQLEKSSSAIADELGVCATTILNYLHCAEIDIRSFTIGYSYKCVTWLEWIMKTENIHICHALNTGEFAIPGTRFRADGYCKESNTIYEFHGNVWHGNPAIYLPTDRPNPYSQMTAGELYQKTQIKEDAIRQKGFNLVVMWEQDWDTIQNTTKI